MAACVVLRDLGLDIGASSLGRGTAGAGAGQHPSNFLVPLSQLGEFLGLFFGTSRDEKKPLLWAR